MEFPSIKRSIIVGGARTSISLEEPFWLRLKDIAARREVTVSFLVHEIALQRRNTNLSSAIRTFILYDCDQRLSDCRQALSAARETPDP